MTAKNSPRCPALAVMHLTHSITALQLFLNYSAVSSSPGRAITLLTDTWDLVNKAVCPGTFFNSPGIIKAHGIYWQTLTHHRRPCQ